jgi:dicarboxylate transporter 10
MQTLDSLAIKHPSIGVIIRASVAESGFQSLYSGLTASLLRQMTYSLVRLGSYEHIKRHITKNRPPSSSDLLLAASIAGGLGGLAGNPAGKR